MTIELTDDAIEAARAVFNDGKGPTVILQAALPHLRVTPEPVTAELRHLMIVAAQRAFNATPFGVRDGVRSDIAAAVDAVLALLPSEQAATVSTLPACGETPHPHPSPDLAALAKAACREPYVGPAMQRFLRAFAEWWNAP